MCHQPSGPFISPPVSCLDLFRIEYLDITLEGVRDRIKAIFVTDIRVLCSLPSQPCHFLRTFEKFPFGARGNECLLHVLVFEPLLRDVESQPHILQGNFLHLEVALDLH